MDRSALRKEDMSCYYTREKLQIGCDGRCVGCLLSSSARETCRDGLDSARAPILGDRIGGCDVIEVCVGAHLNYGASEVNSLKWFVFRHLCLSQIAFEV